MESIAELRKICQTTAHKDRSNAYMRYVSRFFSIYLTRVLLHTSVTPHQVSLAMILVGVIASLFFLSPSPGMFFLGAVLLQFWYLLDCMDGEVARYRHYQKTGSVMMDKREASLGGIYYDIINHYIVNFMVPVTLGFGLFKKHGSEVFLFLGTAGSLGQVLLLAMHDGVARTLLNQIRKFQSVSIRSHEKRLTEESQKNRRSIPHFLFMTLHYLMTYPTIMNLVGIAAVSSWFAPQFPAREILLCFVALGSVLVAGAIIARNIYQDRIETALAEEFLLEDEPRDVEQELRR